MNDKLVIEQPLPRKPCLALFQPDIAGNTGTLMRLSACLGTELHIIEPAGFRLDDTGLKRAGMDYISLAATTRHLDFATFEKWRMVNKRRLILLTTKARQSYVNFSFQPGDILMLGRESAGSPQYVADNADARLLIPMQQATRSINQAVSGAMVLAEALRQTAGFPDIEQDAWN